MEKLYNTAKSLVIYLEKNIELGEYAYGFQNEICLTYSQLQLFYTWQF